MPRHRSRAIGRSDGLRGPVRPRLSAVSHGRVLFDTHNDLRFAVEALSGGLPLTIYAERWKSVRLGPDNFSFV
jgi:hypothetical protein